jgi:hypothetical protein
MAIARRRAPVLGLAAVLAVGCTPGVNAVVLKRSDAVADVRRLPARMADRQSPDSERRLLTKELPVASPQVARVDVPLTGTLQVPKDADLKSSEYSCLSAVELTLAGHAAETCMAYELRAPGGKPDGICRLEITCASFIDEHHDFVLTADGRDGKRHVVGVRLRGYQEAYWGDIAGVGAVIIVVAIGVLW